MPVTLTDFDITNDITALETDETYQLSFISSTPSQDVTLGVPTEITITDDDGELNQEQDNKKLEISSIHSCYCQFLLFDILIL